MNEKLAQAIQYRTEKRYDEARQIFEELITVSPDDPQINYHFAWLHDSQGDESGAVPYYQKAIDCGLSGEDLRGALLGLGSTFRTLGQYENSIEVLQKGCDTFPNANEFPVFLSMALYNVKRHHEAMELLLKTVVSTTRDDGIKRFERAILFYADKLDETWT